MNQTVSVPASAHSYWSRGKGKIVVSQWNGCCIISHFPHLSFDCHSNMWYWQKWASFQILCKICIMVGISIFSFYFNLFFLGKRPHEVSNSPHGGSIDVELAGFCEHNTDITFYFLSDDNIVSSVPTSKTHMTGKCIHMSIMICSLTD